MTSSPPEMCQDCVWWVGDASGEQGECVNGDGTERTITGRYDNCISYLAMHLGLGRYRWD
jgi:hypothetical protein